MRLLKRDLKTYTIKRRTTIKEPDGTTYEGWGDDGTIEANVQPAGGKVMAEMYGERLAYMLVAYLTLDSSIFELDGVYVRVPTTGEPDYKVVAVRPWNTHLVADLEAVR